MTTARFPARNAAGTFLVAAEPCPTEGRPVFAGPVVGNYKRLFQ